MAGPADPQKPKTLLSLPTEIKARIWRLALQNDNKRCTRKHNRRPCRWCIARCPPYKEPALLSVSRQVRNEAQSVWYANATFYFHDGVDKLLEFLIFLGNNKTVKITTLKDEPSFHKSRYALEFLDEVYRKVHALGIQLREEAIEVTYHEGLRLLRTTRAKEQVVALRKNVDGDATVSGMVGARVETLSAEDEFGDDEWEMSDSTIANSDAESDNSADFNSHTEVIADSISAFYESDWAADFL